MLRLALTFSFIGMIAALFGLSGIIGLIAAPLGFDSISEAAFTIAKAAVLVILLVVAFRALRPTPTKKISA